MDENKVIRPMDFVRLTNIDELNVIKDTKNHISMLNDLGNSLSREEWIIGGKDRYTGRDNYGVMLKRYDPIAFEVGYNEWKKQP